MVVNGKKLEFLDKLSAVEAEYDKLLEELSVAKVLAC